MPASTGFAKYAVRLYEPTGRAHAGMVARPSVPVMVEVTKLPAPLLATKNTVCDSVGAPLPMLSVAIPDQRPPAMTFSVPRVSVDGAFVIVSAADAADARSVSSSSNAARIRYGPGLCIRMSEIVASPFASVTAPRR